jgi:hypothetical protein
MLVKLPAYKRVPRLVTLYRRVSKRWPSHPRTLRIYHMLGAAVRAMSR